MVCIMIFIFLILAIAIHFFIKYLYTNHAKSISIYFNLLSKPQYLRKINIKLVNFIGSNSLKTILNLRALT
jgi:hypothetical protein